MKTAGGFPHYASLLPLEKEQVREKPFRNRLPGVSTGETTGQGTGQDVRTCICPDLTLRATMSQ